MAVNTYFGSGKMTAIYKGAVEITKIYYGTGLVYSSYTPPPAIPQIYYDFYVDRQIQTLTNIYNEFSIGRQVEKKI